MDKENRMFGLPLFLIDLGDRQSDSFNLADEAPPSLTVGVLSTLVPLPPGSPQAEKEGTFEWIYTSAAVNPGVNGGPLVDVEGRLVATISGPVPLPEMPWQRAHMLRYSPFSYPP